MLKWDNLNFVAMESTTHQTTFRCRWKTLSERMNSLHPYFGRTVVALAQVIEFHIEVKEIPSSVDNFDR